MKIKQYRSRMEIAVDIDLKYKETHDANISEEVAVHSKTTTTMNRYAHARHNSTVKGIKALDEVYICDTICDKSAQIIEEVIPISTKRACPSRNKPLKNLTITQKTPLRFKQRCFS